MAVARISYQNEAVVEVDSETPILQASPQNGIPHPHVCGGHARCSTCRVLILDGLENCRPRNEKEQKMALRRNFGPNVRLACQTTLGGDVVLRRLVLDDEDRWLVDQEVANAGPRSVGVHYGEAVLGSSGAGERRRLTAIGDAVNVASRIESANKEAGTSFLISQRAYQQVSDQVTTGRSVQLPLKGKTGKFLLHEVTGLSPALDPATTTTGHVG